MQTLDQLLTKIINLQTASEEAGRKPDLLHLTREDELTLIVHEWKKTDLEEKPPSIRRDYSRIAGLSIVWDTQETAVRPRTEEEAKAHQEMRRRGLENMAEINRIVLDHAERKRRSYWGG